MKRAKLLLPPFGLSVRLRVYCCLGSQRVDGRIQYDKSYTGNGECFFTNLYLKNC
ncbi:hypothetical protein M8C21_009190, partial [Ambrosia artemisiifolia]